MNDYVWVEWAENPVATNIGTVIAALNAGKKVHIGFLLNQHDEMIHLTDAIWLLYGIRPDRWADITICYTTPEIEKALKQAKWINLARGMSVEYAEAA